MDETLYRLDYNAPGGRGAVGCNEWLNISETLKELLQRGKPFTCTIVKGEETQRTHILVSANTTILCVNCGFEGF